MASKVEIAQAHKQNFVNNIAHIDGLVGSQQGYTTEQLTEILRQRRVYETLAEAMDLLIEKCDTSGAVDLEVAPGPTNLDETDTKE